MDTKNLDCPCKRTKCERYRNCNACKTHHHSSKHKLLTICERLKLKENRKINQEHN